MICPVCEMGIIEPLVDDKDLRYNICDNCATEIVTPQDSRYNKAKLAVERKNNNGSTKC